MNDDLISRKAVLETIAGIAPDVVSKIDECEFYGYSYRKLETMLLSMPTVPQEFVKKEAVYEMLNKLGGCDAQDDYSKGWDAAIDSAIDSLDKLKD